MLTKPLILPKERRYILREFLEDTLSVMRKVGNLESHMISEHMDFDPNKNGDDYQRNRMMAPVVNFCYEVDRIMRQCEITVR
jgi:hypothetical protein